MTRAEHDRSTLLVRLSLLSLPISSSDRRSLSASAIKDRGLKPEKKIPESGLRIAIRR